jgi:hypothetical protein
MQIPITYENAKNIALKTLNVNQEEEIVIDFCKEAKEYWLFSFDTKKYLETKNIMYAISGNKCIIIDKKDCSINFIDTFLGEGLYHWELEKYGYSSLKQEPIFELVIFYKQYWYNKNKWWIIYKFWDVIPADKIELLLHSLKNNYNKKEGISIMIDKNKQSLDLVVDKLAKKGIKSEIRFWRFKYY